MNKNNGTFGSVGAGRWGGRALLGLLAMLTLALGAQPAGAHTGDQSYLYLDITETSLAGRVEMPFSDVRAFLDLELDGSPDEILVELESNLDLLSDYVAEHLVLGAADSPDASSWAITINGVERLDAEVTDDPEFGYAVVNFDVDTGTSTVPRQFSVTFDPFFDEPTVERDALLLIGNDWEGGVIENPEESLLRFSPESRTQTVDLGDTSWVKNFTASIALGLDHIKTGPDHILFVLVLLLPSVLVFSAGWKPAPSFGAALWRVLKVVTMFTVAHTITFTLAGLDLLPLPSPRLTETIIALSIAAAALHNLRPIARNREWLISFAFGLFHGMGFAGLVGGLDVSRGTQLVSLLGRNVGIEIGQAIVVLLAFPALFLLRRTKYYQPIFIFGSLALVLISLGWMAERLFDAPDITSTLVAGIFAFPRIYVLVALATAAAWALFLLERGKDDLIPVVEAPKEKSERELTTIGY